MVAFYELNVALHVLAAAVWVGGMAAFALVVVPVARSLGPERARDVLRRVGVRFGVVGGVALAVAVLTGLGNLALRGAVPALGTALFWHSQFGVVLAVKLVLVALVVGTSLAHGWLARRSARGSAWLGRATLVLSIAVVVAAVVLVRGYA